MISVLNSARSARSDLGRAVTTLVLVVLILAAAAVGAFFYFGGEADVDIKTPEVSVTTK